MDKLGLWGVVFVGPSFSSYPGNSLQALRNIQGCPSQLMHCLNATEPAFKCHHMLKVQEARTWGWKAVCGPGVKVQSRLQGSLIHQSRDF